MDLLLILLILLVLFGGGGGLYWGMGAGWGIGPIGLIILVLVVAFFLNGARGAAAALKAGRGPTHTTVTSGLRPTDFNSSNPKKLAQRRGDLSKGSMSRKPPPVRGKVPSN